LVELTPKEIIVYPRESEWLFRYTYSKLGFHSDLGGK
jgi:hypothetical protein